MKNRIKRFSDLNKTVFSLILAILLMISAGVFADEAPEKSKIDPSGRGAGYSAVLYDNSNGLPTSEANDIVQSDDGFIWIGGYSGLIRYDGNDFYRYDSSSGISSVVCLYIDSQQRLWIGTNDSGIAVLKYDAFEFYNGDDGLRSLSIRSITEDPQGNIIIATTLGLAYIDKSGKLSLINDELVNGEYVCELYTGTDGVIYGVTLGGDFFTVENKKITGFYSGADMGIDGIYTVYPDPDEQDYVFLGTQDALLYRGSLSNQLKDAVAYSVAPLETVRAIRSYDGVLWIASDNGVGVFDENMNFVLLNDLPMTNSIDHIIRDYEGNMWFSSSRQGIMKIVENRFVDISAIAGLEPLVVNSTCLCGEDLYVGTDTGLYVIDKDYALKQNSVTERLAGARIRCIKRDSRGMVWFCTYSSNAFVRYDPATDTVESFTEEEGMLSNRVRMFTELSDGSLAVATNAGMNIIKDGKVTASYGSNAGISNLEILCIEEGTDGKLYLGTDGGGIYVIDGAKVTRMGVENGLKSEVVLRLKKDPFEDLMWIITSNSVSYLKDGKITTLKTMPYTNNFDLFFDVNKRAWILSSNGIHIIKREDLIKDTINEYTLFDKDYGMPGIATANSYSQITDEGMIYVAATTGVFTVNINENTDGGSDIKMTIPFISVDDNLLWIKNDTEIHIPSDCKRLNIYANVFTYSLNNPHLSYCLEGFDDEPRRLTKQDMSYASYTNLKGGTYTFKISLINDVTGQIERTVTLKIIKDKSIFEQVWFMILIVILGIALIGFAVWLYIRRKTAALLKKQEENRKLINEMTKVFSGCIDMKDAYTNGHSSRVAKYSAMFAERLGKSPAEVEEVYNIALLHDIGKIGIPDNILNKPGRLDDDEFKVMKSHAQSGRDILDKITIDPNLAQGAGYHHEKYDGTGYPSGLKGEEIPEIARIIAVADAFDAMYSTRPYRKKMAIEDAAKEIKRCCGTQFAPEVVKVFLELVEEGKLTDDEIA